MYQPPAVAFTAFTEVWPSATEMEIGTTLCAIGAGKDFGLNVINANMNAYRQLKGEKWRKFAINGVSIK